MIYRTLKEDIDAYYAHGAINQSALKELIQNGIEAFIDKYQMLISTSELYYEEKAHFVIGNAVDCRITQGVEEFDKQYHISTLVKKPGEKAMSVIRRVFDEIVLIEKEQDHTIGSLDIYKEAILRACVEHEYNNRWGIDAKLNGILREDGGYTVEKDKEPIFKGGGYWEDLKKAVGKQILTDIESQTVVGVYNSLMNHPHTAELFKDKYDTDIIYQFPIFFIVDGIECKGLIDKIIINHTTKKIMPCDIKTIGDYITNFRRKIKGLRYDIQGSFYSYGLSISKNNINKLIGKDVSDYSISNFAFITESTIKQGCPLIFVLNKELIEQGRYGDSTAENNLRFGWQHGLDIYKMWSEKYAFNLERRVEDTNGVIFVDEHYEYTNL